MIDRHSERRSQWSGIRFHHHWKLETFGRFGKNRHAELSASVTDHEVDDFGRNLVGCADKIAFVFSVLIVDDNHHAAEANGLNGCFNS